ncbi:calcium-binding protein [Seohaeicola zhoushanensis]
MRSGVNLGGATLEVDVSDVAALGQGSFELIHVDELIGTFGAINIVGLASNQAAKVVVNYTTDKVILHLGALGSGKGVATLQTVGEPSDAKADAGLYAILTDGHGVYPVDRPDGGFSDTLDGSENNDTLKGSMGNSQIKGFSGNDTLRGRAGEDTLHGGAGDDTLYGNRQADSLFGDDGNDTLFGGTSRDQLFGGKGDDMLWGELGNDRLTGGDGKDGFGFGENFGRDRIIDFQIGIDKIHLDYAGASFEDLLFRGRGGDTVINTSQGVIVLEGIAVGDLSVSDFVF